MLKFLKILGACLVIVMTASLSVSGRMANERQHILIRSGNPTLPPPTDPNTPLVCPISCSVDDETGEISIYFMDDLGYVATTVTAMGTGIVASASLNSELGICQLYIPANPGFYEITFQTTGGDHFSGEFIL